jgi:acetyltransferase EpsM
MKKIIILGAGGNSKVIIDIIQSRILAGEELEIIGILDDDANKVRLKGYPNLGPVSSMDHYKADPEIFFVNGIGSNAIRKKVFQQYPEVQYYTAIHPSALIGSDVVIGPGSVIMPGAIINTGSRIGKHVLINTGAIIEHDNIVGDFVHVASGVTTAGNVEIGETSMLGTGTKVIQGLKIGKSAMIGAGAVVVSDIPDNCTAFGVPARVKK